MTTILTIANHKGGVGKTALAAHIAWYYAGLGQRVLAVDLDAQANYTATFTTRDDVIRPGAADALFDEDAAMPTPALVADNLHLIRASIELDTIDARSEIETVYAFRDRLPKLAQQHHCDIVVIDTPPTLKARTTAAISSSTHVITPFVPEVYSITGLEDLFRHIARVRRTINHGLRDPIGVCNLVNPQASLHSHLITDVAKQMTVLKPYLNRRIAVAEALASQQPVWSMKGAKIAGDEWRALCATIDTSVRA